MRRAEPGQGWADLAVYHQETGEAYDSDGTVRPFTGDGHAISTSAFLILREPLYSPSASVY